MSESIIFLLRETGTLTYHLRYLTMMNSQSTQKQRKRVRPRDLAIGGGLLVTMIVGFISFSPYGYHKGFDYPLIIQTIVIDAEPETVFKYLGNSSHAADWSVFVDHISPTNDTTIQDGEIGSERRCFGSADETGIIWDERITKVEPGAHRQLEIYHLQGLELKADHLLTDQLYRRTNGLQTSLSLTLHYGSHQPTFWVKLKTYLAAYKISSIFAANLINIKKQIEADRQNLAQEVWYE